MLMIAAILLVGFLVPQTLKAQANPYPVTNNLTCPIRVNVDTYTQAGTASTPLCALCMSIPGTLIPPGATVFFPLAAACMPACDIVVSVTEIGGITITPVSDGLSTSSASSGPGAACAPVVTVNTMLSGAFVY